MADIKVSFPEPCSEPWDAMEPRGCDRHGANCDTIIHDLSLLTVEEVEAALDGNDKLCVRAMVKPDGSIKTAETGTKNSRLVRAAFGASASLALAACQTTPQSNVSPRYEISGQLKQYSWALNAQLKSDTGMTYTKRMWSDGKFRFSNLRPGTYTLSLLGTCEEVRKFENLIVDRDIVLNEIETNDDNDCIIIGVMQRADRPKMG